MAGTSKQEDELYYLELSSTAPTTILLIHGFLSSHLEWSYVTPHLKTYHLLIPDTPGHSRSSHLLPATIPAASDHIASLIRTRAHGGRAHVVGMSVGGFTALNLALPGRYPELVLSVFASGCAPFQGRSLFFAAHPSIVWYMMYSMAIMPLSVYRWQAGRQGLLPHEEVYGEVLKNRRWEVTRDVFESIGELGWGDVRGIEGAGVRTLALAGEKRDNVEGVEGERELVE